LSHKGHVESADRDELSKKRSELKDIEASLADLETQFIQNLGFLRRGVLNEQGFVKANNMARDQQSAFQESKGALSNLIEEQAGREQAIERVPGMVKTFLEDFRNMEPRMQKAHLQHQTQGSLRKSGQDRLGVQALDELDVAVDSSLMGSEFFG